MTTAPADILDLPKPAWAADDVAMLYDMATRFMSEEIAPRYDEFEKNEMVDRASWEKAGAAGLVRVADARPELPRPVGRLPDAEIDGLLPVGGERTQIGVARHGPPVALDLRHESRRFHRRL